LCRKSCDEDAVTRACSRRRRRRSTGR
jgi:hypothetical protein